jgi:hypothetical protein
MKIKTITSHDVYNYGASLQAYALMTYLQSLGHDVEIIDYKPEYVLRRYNYMWVNPESVFHKFWITRFIYRILKFIQRQTTMLRKKSIDNFTKEYLKTTSTYHSNEDLKKNPPLADAYFVGSDQVWNTLYDAGKDPAFYLDFAPMDTKKISYAASFSATDNKKEHQLLNQHKLKKFNNISVREHHGLQILESMNLKGIWVADPVFLLTKEHWGNLLKSFKKKEKYILIYDFERNRLLKEFARYLAKLKDLKIYSVNDTYPLLYADRNFNNAGPLDFITLIYNADYFISNSLHGTLFSILFEKDFFVFGRTRHKVNSRMESILKLVQLEDRYITSNKDFPNAFHKIDYKYVNQILLRHIAASKEYIDQALA